MTERKKIAVLVVLERVLDRTESFREQLISLRDELRELLKTDRIIVQEM